VKWRIADLKNRRSENLFCKYIFLQDVKWQVPKIFSQ
jgi:hypothetical protein